MSWWITRCRQFEQGTLLFSVTTMVKEAGSRLKLTLSRLAIQYLMKIQYPYEETPGCLAISNQLTNNNIHQWVLNFKNRYAIEQKGSRFFTCVFLSTSQVSTCKTLQYHRQTDKSWTILWQLAMYCQMHWDPSDIMFSLMLEPSVPSN